MPHVLTRYVCDRCMGRHSYGTFTSTLSQTNKKLKKHYKALGEALREQVAPLILQTYMQQLDGLRQGQYCTRRVLFCYLFFLNEMYGRTALA